MNPNYIPKYIPIKKLPKIILKHKKNIKIKITKKKVNLAKILKI